MYPLAVFVIAFVLGMVFAREIRAALVIAVVFTLVTVGLLAWNSESDRKQDRAERGQARDAVPQALVGVWEGEFSRHSSLRERQVRVSVAAGSTGAVVAVVRITRLSAECVETATLRQAYENRVVLQPTRMPGTKESCGGPYELTVKGDHATFGGNASAEAAVSRSQPWTAPALGTIVGQWRGTYVCGQGETGVTLTIRSADGNQISAVFAFYPVRSNPDVPTGTSAKVGVYHDGHLTLQHDRWIKRPNGYHPVDVSADVTAANPRTMTGKMLSRSCDRFTVTR